MNRRQAVALTSTGIFIALTVLKGSWLYLTGFLFSMLVWAVFEVLETVKRTTAPESGELEKMREQLKKIDVIEDELGAVKIAVGFKPKNAEAK